MVLPFGGNKLAMAAALEAMHDGLSGRESGLECHLTGATGLLSRTKISAVRGLGMMIGIETSASLSKIVEGARRKA